MDILKCYKILELDHEPSREEVREAYIDMVRVWHPDRFTNNPRLRKKAEEKLKEINIAYAEIRALVSTKPEVHRTKKAAQWAQGALTDLKQRSRRLLFPKINLGGVSNRRSQNNDSISKRAGRMSKGRDKHRNFADIYEEVARARKEEKRKMREMR
jgi:curved DNA-binding protein CbpA